MREKNPTKVEAGRKGGLTTVQRHGRQHMSKIGKRGYQVTASRYDRKPVNQSQWAFVSKATGKIVCIF